MEAGPEGDKSSVHPWWQTAGSEISVGGFLDKIFPTHSAPPPPHPLPPAVHGSELGPQLPSLACSWGEDKKDSANPDTD